MSKKQWNPTRAVLEALLLEHGSAVAVGKAVGVSNATVSQRAKAHGLKLRRGRHPGGPGVSRPREWNPTRAELEALLVEHGSTRAVAGVEDVSHTLVARRAAELGIEQSGPGRKAEAGATRRKITTRITAPSLAGVKAEGKGRGLSLVEVYGDRIRRGLADGRPLVEARGRTWITVELDLDLAAVLEAAAVEHGVGVTELARGLILAGEKDAPAALVWAACACSRVLYVTPAVLAAGAVKCAVCGDDFRRPAIDTDHC